MPDVGVGAAGNAELHAARVKLRDSMAPKEASESTKRKWYHKVGDAFKRPFKRKKSEPAMYGEASEKKAKVQKLKMR